MNKQPPGCERSQTANCEMLPSPLLTTCGTGCLLHPGCTQINSLFLRDARPESGPFARWEWISQHSLRFPCTVAYHRRQLRTIAKEPVAIRLAPPTISNTKEVGLAIAATELFNSSQPARVRPTASKLPLRLRGLHAA